MYTMHAHFFLIKVLFLGDLKPANFVFVKGHLKLIDFGIAKAFSNDTTNIYRESQIGTVFLLYKFFPIFVSYLFIINGNRR